MTTETPRDPWPPPWQAGSWGVIPAPAERAEAARRAGRHPGGCAFCPVELLGLPRDRTGAPLCQTCPHRAEAARPRGEAPTTT